ncbi:MAG TPA: carbonic anhydrase [Verrucomicrobiae bacterium]|jgi:carbonic anhydrase
MRLLEAILDANHRAVDGDGTAGLHIAEYATELPLVAVTCIDPRLNRFFPGVLGLPDEHFIWLRNAGNIITGPLSSTMRSLALACAVKNGREIAIIGHTDCGIRHTTISDLTERFKALGIERHQLPENLTEYFGVFASERQNVIRSVEFVRQSPLIGPKIPVQGLIVDTQTGRLEWVVNGYDVLARPGSAPTAKLAALGRDMEDLAAGAGFNLGQIRFSETKIGETAAEIKSIFEAKPPPPLAAPIPAEAPVPAAPALPPPPMRPRAVPIPPPIQLHPGGRKR